MKLELIGKERRVVRKIKTKERVKGGERKSSKGGGRKVEGKGQEKMEKEEEIGKIGERKDVEKKTKGGRKEVERGGTVMGGRGGRKRKIR